METIVAVLLFCSISTPRPECQVGTAVDVVRPPHAASFSTCGMHAQAYLATTTLVPGTDTYLKAVCQRQKVGEPPVTASR